MMEPQSRAGEGPAALSASAARPTVSHMLGELTWLLTQSPTHKHFTFADLEWMILPPLMLEQYRVFRMNLPEAEANGAGQSESNQASNQQPVGYATWATLSEDAEAKLIAGADTGTGARLRPDEWKSGARLWLVDMVLPRATAENKLAEACLADLLQGPLKGKKIKYMRANPDTKQQEVGELGGDA